MSSPQKGNFHLTSKQRFIIEYEISLGKTPKEVISTWDSALHGRNAPSLQTIYSIHRQILRKDGVEPKKSGPKKRSVLNSEKLAEVERTITENDSMTYEDLCSTVQLPLSTCYEAVKLIDFHQHNAKEEEVLTDAQKEQRLKFCSTFLRWNESCKMSVWLSDESLFSVDIISRYRQKGYFAKKNQNRKSPKKFREQSFTVWSAIRGDGSVLFEIMDGKQRSENYIQLLLNMFPKMDCSNSFLMQDGSGIHTSGNAIDWINFFWKDRWIGLKSSRLEFPPKSMDLTPMDFTFWSYIKRRIAAQNPETTEELKEIIGIEMGLISKDVIINTVSAKIMFKRVGNDVSKKCN